VFALYANIAYMNATGATLGSEIRRLRLVDGTALRQFALSMGISASHLSDIEHDRRRPSKELLKKIARGLRPVGATHEGLQRLDTRFESDLQEWASQTPEVKRILRAVKESGRPAVEVLKDLEDILQKRRK
jgi:transcriptional regulator with XRE-family HTH domain